MIVVLLLLCVLLLAWANGANDNFKPVATIYGSSTLSYRAALALATAAQLAGSLLSIVLAVALLEAFGGKGLVPDTVVADGTFLVAVAAGAAGTLLLATRLGLPISTTHALVGGLTGAGLTLAPGAFAWAGLGPKYMLPLLLSPALAVVAAGLLYPFASRVRRTLGIDAVTCLCIGRRVEPVVSDVNGALALARGGLELTISQVEQCRSRYDGTVLGVGAQRTVDVLHLASGFALGFARGLNDTPKVVAVLVAASWSAIDMRVAIGIVAIVMAAGGIVHSRRIARTMGERITEMNTGQGLLANVVSSTLVIGASLLGAPVSTTHVSTGSIFGIGIWTGKADRKVIGEILLAWLFTLPVAALLAASMAALLA